MDEGQFLYTPSAAYYNTIPLSVLETALQWVPMRFANKRRVVAPPPTGKGGDKSGHIVL
jgi:hypothetical protein